MNQIIFKNPGLIDLRAIRILGWSVKESTNPIGFFGTGSRFAIATLLRTNHSVVLWRGLEKYVFGLTKVEARANNSFNVVTMTGPDGQTEELAFTSQLGKTWLPWMGFRELHSNVLDEKGVTVCQDSPYEPIENQTAFCVVGYEIEAAYNQRDSIFLPTQPLYEDASIAVHPGLSTHGYYRGVRVCTLDRPSLYTYNLKTTLRGITEDRTLTDISDLGWYVGKFIEKCSCPEFLRTVMLAPDTRYENHLPSYASEGTEAFFSTYAKVRTEGNATLLANWADRLYLAVRKTLPLPEPIALSKIQEKQLAKAIAFCRAAGWDVDSYPIITVPSAHGGLLALAENGKIVLTEKLYDLGVKALVGALLEEYTHLKYGFRDHTREMQTHLFDKLVSAKEEIIGEPL